MMERLSDSVCVCVVTGFAEVSVVQGYDIIYRDHVLIKFEVLVIAKIN